MSTYEKFEEIMGTIRNLEKSITILTWDERTYMPEGAVNGRSEMKKTLSQLKHKKLTSDKMKKLINELNKPSINSKLDDIQKAAVREMTRKFERNYNIPDELIMEISKQSSKAEKKWEKAKEKSDFDIFLPHLKKQIELHKKKAEYIDYENEPFDALLDEYQPGLTAKKVEDLFNPTIKKLKKFIDRLLSEGKKSERDIFKGKKFDVNKQIKLCKEITNKMGFDYQHGRLDEIAHPYTFGIEDDVRITNSYSKENVGSIFSAMHEAGHGLYEQGISEDIYGTCLSYPLSLGYHEGQARFWENIVGHSREFIDYLFPKLKRSFPQLKEYSAQEYYESINSVGRSLVRIESDEVTYTLHIGLRFDIESGLFRDEINPEELNEVWNNKMEEYVGLRPKDPSKGVLQDVHWSIGLFGLFPNYALGNMYASQIFKQIEKDIPDVKNKFREGQFEDLLSWLKENIYKYGRRYRPDEMTKKLTGEPLNHKYYINYLEDKYKSIYDL